MKHYKQDLSLTIWVNLLLSHNGARIESTIKSYLEDWSPGLVVMGGDSRPEGRGFKSQHRMLDGHFFTCICCKNCNVCLKRQK